MNLGNPCFGGCQPNKGYIPSVGHPEKNTKNFEDLQGPLIKTQHLFMRVQATWLYTRSSMECPSNRLDQISWLLTEFVHQAVGGHQAHRVEAVLNSSLHWDQWSSSSCYSIQLPAATPDLFLSLPVTLSHFLCHQSCDLPHFLWQQPLVPVNYPQRCTLSNKQEHSVKVISRWFLSSVESQH